MHSDDRESRGVFAHYLLEMQHAFSFTESLMGQSSSEYFLLHMRQHAQEDTRMQARMHTCCKFKNDDGSMHLYIHTHTHTHIYIYIRHRSTANLVIICIATLL